MSQEINQRILDALNEGYNPQDILSAFSMSKDPEHQSWYENYSQNMRDRARETNMIDQRSVPGKPGLGVMERVKKHVEETPGEQLAGEATLAAGGLYAGKRLLQKAFPTPGEQGLAEQNKIARERLELAKNPVLSPLEEARLETEKAKAEYQRKRIEMLDRQMAKVEAGKQLSPADQNLLNLYEQQRAAKQATAQTEINKQMGFATPGAPTAQPPVAGGQPPAPPAPAGAVPPQNRIPSMMAAQEMSNPLGGLASAYTEPLRPPPTVAEMGQQSGGAVSEAAKAPAAAIPPAEKSKGGRKGEGKDKQWTYKSASELPQGTVFKEGWGGADNWLNDQVGKERAREIRNTFNQGRGFGSGKEAMKSAADAMKEAGQLNFMSQGGPFVLGAENRERFGIPPPKQHGRLGETYYNPNGPIKVAGAAGLLLSMAEAANAAQGTKEALKKGDRQMAASEAAELLNLHPVTGLLNQLFGTSPQELETLRKADYARKVGGGRGIVPPSAYMR